MISFFRRTRTLHIMLLGLSGLAGKRVVGGGGLGEARRAESDVSL